MALDAGQLKILDPVIVFVPDVVNLSAQRHQAHLADSLVAADDPLPAVFPVTGEFRPSLASLPRDLRVDRTRHRVMATRLAAYLRRAGHQTRMRRGVT